MARVYGTKSIEEALKHLLRVAECNPNDPFIWHSIGLQFYSIKCYNDALKYFLRSEKIKSNISAANLFYIGDCLRRAGQVEEAIKYFEKSITIPVRNRVDYKVSLGNYQNCHSSYPKCLYFPGFFVYPSKPTIQNLSFT